mmetsp:Transcript_51154/g.61584  ORF Transcript_51154/g.61584 Transcript_51154/m.61584 type:complete len:108 (+) Transcript_51154:935-1258(+)
MNSSLNYVVPFFLFPIFISNCLNETCSLFQQHNPIELLVDNAEQRNDVLIYIFHLVQKYATREVSWDDLEVKVEKEFELPEGSLKNELRTLEVHLNRSRFLALRSAK